MKHVLLFALLLGCGASELPPPPPPATLPTPPPPPPATSTPRETTSAAPPPAPPAPPTPPVPPAEEKKHDLVVSFFSPGDGTDGAAFDRLRKIIDSTKPPPVETSVRWGKEGEHDECLDLSPLAEKDRRLFVARVKREVGSSKRVKITEHAACSGP